MIMMKSAGEWMEKLGLPVEIETQSGMHSTEGLIQAIQDDVRVYVEPL